MSTSHSEWKKHFSSYISDAASASELAARVAESDDFSHAIQLFCSKHTLPTETVSRLTLLLDVLVCTDNHLPLVFFLLEDPSIQSILDVARTFWSLGDVVGVPKTNPKQVSDFQTKLYHQEPTAVICGLVSRQVLKHEDKTIQELAIAFLQRSLVQRFDIRRMAMPLQIAKDDIVQNLKKSQKRTLVRFLETLQRLYPLIEDPRHMQHLIEANYASAHDVASTSDFVDRLTAKGLPKAAALEIQRRAVSIDFTLEQRWVDFMRSRKNIPVVALEDGDVTPVTSEEQLTISSLFGEVDHAQVDEWTSVLSPSAYLVDLLEFLRYSVIDKPAEPNTKATNPPKPESSTTLLQELCSRRYDIVNLQLSKPNTLNTVRYCDLAIEIMESYVSNSGKKQSDDIVLLDAVNETSLQGDAKSGFAFANTNWDTFQNDETLLKLVAPMKTFPFNLASHTTRDLLAATGVSKDNLFTLFQDRDEARQLLKISDDNHAYALVDIALSRRLAAERLAMDEPSFVAVTKEAFTPFDFLRHVEGPALGISQYNQRIGLKSTGEYWNYVSDDKTSADQRMLDELPTGTGLDHVTSEFLERASITFEELIAILDTEYVAKTLLVSVQTEDGHYTDDYAKMRLILSPLAKDGLTLAECYSRLNSFIRLWRHLGWPIHVLDNAIAIVEDIRMSGTRSSRLLEIKPETIEDLAAIAQLSKKCVVAVSELLPLWGEMSYKYPDSLYQQLFMRPHLISQYPSLQDIACDRAKDSEGSELDSDDDSEEGDSNSQDEITIASHSTPLRVVLGVKDEELDTLLQITQVKLTDPWGIGAVSSLYRFQLLCTKLLDIPISLYETWCKTHTHAEGALAGPQMTLNVWEKWSSLRATKCSSEWLLQVLSPSLATHSLPTEEDIETAIKLLDKYKGIASHDEANSSLQTEDRRIYSPEVLVLLCETLFASNVANDVIALVQGTKSYQVPVVIDVAGVIPKQLPQKLSITSQNLIWNGLMIDSEREDLIKAKPNDENWTQAVAAIYEQSKIVQAHVSSILDGVATQVLAMFNSSIEEDNKSEPVKLENILLKRRKYFIELASPHYQRKMGQLAAEEFMKQKYSLISPSLAEAILTSIKCSTMRNTDARANLAEMLHCLNEDAVDLNNKDFNGYFVARESTAHIFTPPKQSKLWVDGLSSEQGTQLTCQLIEGKAYTVKFVDAESPITSTKVASVTTPPRYINTGSILAKQALDDFKSILRVFDFVSHIMELFKLKCEDVETLILTGVNLVQPMWHDLQSMQTLYEFREAFFKGSNKLSVNKFLDTIGKDSVQEMDMEITASLLVPGTGWSQGTMKKFITKKVQDHRGNAKLLYAKNRSWIYECIRELHQVVNFLKQTKLPSYLIMNLAKLRLPWDIKPQFDSAKSMALLLLEGSSTIGVSKACESLSVKKKEALIHYLLAQKTFKEDLKIHDADGLFEHFLIDVQMGPEQQTSRIQQAIATIQLFVQRCLLGLEAKGRIRDNSIDRKKWQWMHKFTLWQANRRLFLFPENWIEPTLRDDKSDAFAAVEAAILQANLSREKIVEIIQQYVYTAHEIADLEIQTYLWEGLDHFRGTYHFFARTRTAPYAHYHRLLKISGLQESPLYSWFPWKKLDIDIPIFEADYDGSTLPVAGSYMVPAFYRGRLFLFMPRITLKTAPKPPPRTGNVDEFTKTQLDSLGTDHHWQVKMSWSECRNGTWSTVHVSSTSLDVAGNDPRAPETKAVIQVLGKFAQVTGPWGGDSGTTHPTVTDAIVDMIRHTASDENALPSISAFRFTVHAEVSDDCDAKKINTKSNSSEDRLTIKVSRWLNKGDSSDLAKIQSLGRFEMRGTQMVVVGGGGSSSSGAAVDTHATYFNKLHLCPGVEKRTVRESLSKHLEEYELVENGEQLKTRPNMTIPPDSKDSKVKYNWVMSYNTAQTARPVGLVVERITDSVVETYFSPAPRELDGSLDSKTIELVESERLSYTTSQALMESSTTTNAAELIFSVLSQVPQLYQSTAFGGLGQGLYSELASPYSYYNWELGFHLIMLLVERLLATQQFELGLEVAQLVFDPYFKQRKSSGAEGKQMTTASESKMSETSGSEVHDSPSAGSKDKSSSLVTDCWHFLPFKSSALRCQGSMGRLIKQLKPGRQTSNEVLQWLDNPFNAHSLARSRPAIYMRRFINKYIELLIECGDVYFRQESMESIPLAVQRYIQASHLFGNAPRTLPSPTKPTIMSYREISSVIDDFSSAAVDLELSFPFFASTPKNRDAIVKAPSRNGVLGMVRSSYFSIPANPELAALRERIDDRLYKIRHSLDINGNVRKLPLFDPPLDPGALVRAVAAGGIGAVSFAATVDGPMPNYRFVFLLQKAFELCAEVRSQSDAYLSIREKRDSERLSILRTGHETSSQVLTLEIKKMQREDAQKALETLEETRQSHVMRLKYYLALIGEAESKVPGAKDKWEDIQQVIKAPTRDELVMSPEEFLESQKIEESLRFRNIASALERSASVLMALPNLSSNVQPMGIGASLKFDAANIAQGMQLVASAFQTESTTRSDEASRSARKGQMIRQLQERRLAANTAGRDIKNADLQIESHRIKLSLCDREIEAHKKQMADSAEVLEFLRTKYSNEKLYAWMDSSLANSLYQTYVLAMDLAKSAEKAFMFERGQLAAGDTLLAPSYWDDSRQGAFAAQNLYLGLKRLESAYHKRKSHDYEITKNVSLRQLDPWKLLALQEEGNVSFNLPEYLFDMDFPGHYCRRIKSVAVTIPCVHGPYTSVACTLRLLSHCYRLRQSNGASSSYYPSAQELDSDMRYRTDRVPISAVAISSANQDTGCFEGSFNGERYGPFEGAGVISSWLLSLPKVKQFDYRTISDVILHVKYTSLDGGAGWSEKASAGVQAFQKENSGQSFTLPIELNSSMVTGYSKDENKVTMEARDLKSQLPFWTQTYNKVDITQICLVASKTCKIDDSASINGDKVTPKDKSIGSLKVFQVPAVSSWKNLVVTLPGVGPRDIQGGSLWALVLYTVS